MVASAPRASLACWAMPEKLMAVMDGVGNFMRDDEVVLRFHRALHIIAHGSSCLARPFDGARIGIGQRNLRVF